MSAPLESIDQDVFDIPGTPVLHTLSDQSEAVTDVDLTRCLGLTLDELRQYLRDADDSIEHVAPALEFMVHGRLETGRDKDGWMAIAVLLAVLVEPGTLPPGTLKAATACVRELHRVRPLQLPSEQEMN